MVKTFLKPFGIVALWAFLAASFSACADIGDGGTASTREINSSQTQTAFPETQPTSSQAQTQSGTADDTIKVGAILPLTGERTSYGIPMQKVAQIVLDEINGNGGVNGKKLEFIWGDGKCNADDASQAANKLINVDQVKIIYGGFCNGETLAIAPIAEQAHVVVLSPGSSSPDITNAGDYIFRNYPSDSTQGKILAEGAQKMGFKKVGIIVEKNDYTLGIQKVFEEQFQLAGGDAVTENYLQDETDLKTPLLKLKSEGVDALFVDPQTPAKADLIFKELEEMKWDVKLMANDVVAGYQDLINKYAKFVDGMIVAEFTYDKENPDFKKLAEKYKEIAGKELPYGTNASTAYDAVYIIREGLAKVGNDADAFKDYLYNIQDRKGLGGTLTIDENGDPTNGYSLEIVKNGKVITYKE